MGRRKSHHTHETTDAYAEGWDARLAWKPDTPEPVNPYSTVVVTPMRKQSDERKIAQSRDERQWQEGWFDCDDDLLRQDLAEVKAADFKHAPKVGAEPTEDVIFDEEDEDDL